MWSTRGTAAQVDRTNIRMIIKVPSCRTARITGRRGPVHAHVMRLHLSVLRKLATASLNSLGFWRGISCEALLIAELRVEPPEVEPTVKSLLLILCLIRPKTCVKSKDLTLLIVRVIKRRA